MSTQDHDAGAGIAQAVVERETESGTRHAAVEELAGYLDGSLDEARSHGVREHLLDCPTCTDRLLDLEALRSAEERGPQEGEDPEWDLARAESWKRLRASLSLERSPAGPSESRAGSSAATPRRASTWAWLAVAAAAGLLAFKLTARLLRRLRRSRSRRSR